MTGEGEPAARWPGMAVAGQEGLGLPEGRPAFDTSVAHQARMYDYLLGGKDNFYSHSRR